MKNLKVTLVQAPLYWEQPEKNRKHFSLLLKNVRRSSTDVIVLPEMFNTGFTMNAASNFESMSGPTLTWMKEMAADKNAVVCGSIIIKEKGKYYNRLIWVQPDGKTQQYDKRHLFTMADEHLTFTAGKKRLVVEYKGWKICPLVCYDLRFPVWSRNKNEYDLLLYVANWPERRSFAWKNLLVARAIENQCYVAGLNRVGLDGTGVKYSGDSVVLSAMGETLSSIKGKGTSVETITLEYNKLHDFRKQFPVLNDSDDFRLK